MLSRLTLYLLGPPQLFLDNAPITTARRKAIALLAYLASERGQHRRESLSALLWPDYDQPKAFTNLRHTLWEIQQSLGEGWLITDRATLEINPTTHVWLDVDQFVSLLAQGRIQSDRWLRISLLRDAVKLYRDHFLTGFSLKDSSVFNDWGFSRSEDLRCQLAGALISLSEEYCALGQSAQAIPYARRLLTFDPLNESAHRRLMYLYLQADQQGAALKQYQACQKILRKELQLDPQPETYALYKQIRKGEIKPGPVAQPAEPAPRHNLPLQLSSCIGREKEQREIVGLLEHHRLVTLTGTGGIGKTRLSIQVASALLNDFPDGTWMVEFASLIDPGLLPEVVKTTLGLIEQPGLSSTQILTNFLGGKRTLLIFDNCEHLVHACAELAETLLRACSNLHILATSREALGTDGEMVYRVPTLTNREPLHVMIETISQYEAVLLFVERAHLAVPDFSITPDNILAVAQICHHLDGIPLALELAAARIKVLSVQQIAERLKDALSLLTEGKRTAPERHQTLRATMDWSYELLSKKDQTLFQRLSVFADGFTLEAAEIVCSGVGRDSILSNDVLDLLTSLVNKSLIIAEPEQSAQTRYHMLEIIRQYAYEKLSAANEAEIMRQRHLLYFVDLAEQAEPNLHMSTMVMWLDRLESELSNLRAALERALESDIEMELRLASALCRFWQLRDHNGEGTEWLERALSIERAERGGQPLTLVRTKIRGKALNVAGYLRLVSYEATTAAELSRESLALFQELGPTGTQGQAYALFNLGAGADQQKDHRLSKTLIKQCLGLFQEVGDKFGIAQCFPIIAYTALTVDGDYEKASFLAEEGLALYKEIGDKNGLARILWTLGYAAYLQGDYNQAKTRYEASLALFRDVGNKYAVGAVLYDLGEAAKSYGDYRESMALLEEAMAFARGSGMSDLAAEAGYSIGEVATVQGNSKQATIQYQELLAIGQKTGNQKTMADALFGLGRTACMQGDLEEAIRKFNQALAFSRESRNKFGTARALYGLGRVAQLKEDYVTARSFYLEAIMICQEISHRFLTGLHMAALAVLAAVEKQIQKAARLFSIAENLHAGIRFEMLPAERAEYEQIITIIRGELCEAAFVEAWEAGKQMTLDEAVAYATRGIEPKF